MQLSEAVGNSVYVSPDGLGITYFLPAGEEREAGLYLVDVANGLDIRVLELDSMLQRGLLTKPTWLPDSSAFALTLATGYATDIILINREGVGRNLTQSGSYDFLPVFSPTGDYLAFVSDRQICPSWIPGDPETCNATDTPQPDGGHLYVLELATGNVEQLSDIWITQGNAPQWINDTQIAFAQGEPLFGDTERTLWIADIIAGSTREIRPRDAENPLMLAESWSADGSRVLYQAAIGDTTRLLLADVNSNIIATLDDLNFPRYGISADWSPVDQRVSVGGVSGQCPFGEIVLDENLNYISNNTAPPSMCTPRYSPDGEFIAFVGVSLNQFDGRADVYVANASGLSTVNITGDLRGTMTMLGWIR